MNKAKVVFSRLMKNSILFFFAVIMLSGCTTVHKNFKTYSPVPDQRGKTTAKVAIVLTDELCSFYYIPRDFQEFSLGPVLCENAGNAAKAAFSQPLFFKNTNEAISDQADFIGVLRPRIAYLYGFREIPATVLTYASLSWELLSGEGKRLYGATIYGDGRDQRTFGMSDVRYESSMQQCMDDLTANLYKEMIQSPQRAAKNIAASGHIRATVEGYQPGITTYAQYRNRKNKEWHIFAVHERAKYGEREFSYLFDPVSKKHFSVVGWESRWGLRLPAIESLRPSVYLPQSKIDQTKVNSVYIKELVGSVYDDRPLCELVFEGESIDNSILKNRSCPGSFLSSTSYLSVDAYRNRKLDNTAQQWVKLRIGMSKEEAGRLIGAPRRWLYDSSTNVTTFEFGYGRVIFYGKNDEGLSGWQLD
jgi:hypothetical protein